MKLKNALFDKDRYEVQHRINTRDTVLYTVASLFSIAGGAAVIAQRDVIGGAFNYIFAALILVLGIAAAIYYFIAHEYRETTSNRLVLALLLVAFAIVVFFLPSSPTVVCVLWGAICVFRAATQIQNICRKRSVTFSAIGHAFMALVGFVIGIALLLAMTGAVNNYALVLGISLIFYGLTTATELWNKVKYANYALRYVGVVGNNIWMETVGFFTVFNMRRGKNVKTLRFLRYDEDENKLLYLNLHLPKHPAPGKLPVVIYTHGGGWVTGLPENREGFTTNIASAGYAVVNVFYGLAPVYHHPQQVQNIYKALAWLTLHADDYNLDMSSVTMAGESAGGHLASMVGAIATNPKYKALFDLDPVSRDIKVNALILNCGVYDLEQTLATGFNNIEFYVQSYVGESLDKLDETTRKAISPIHYVTTDFPPSYVITGEADKLAVCGRTLVEKLDELGVSNVHYEGKGRFAIHAFAIAQILKISRRAMAGIKVFLKAIIFPEKQ